MLPVNISLWKTHLTSNVTSTQSRFLNIRKQAIGFSDLSRALRHVKAQQPFQSHAWPSPVAQQRKTKTLLPRRRRCISRRTLLSQSYARRKIEVSGTAQRWGAAHDSLIICPSPHGACKHVCVVFSSRPRCRFTLWCWIAIKAQTHRDNLQ
jgi:hypothetical protein